MIQRNFTEPNWQSTFNFIQTGGVGGQKMVTGDRLLDALLTHHHRLPLLAGSKGLNGQTGRFLNRGRLHWEKSLFQRLVDIHSSAQQGKPAVLGRGFDFE